MLASGDSNFYSVKEQMYSDKRHAEKQTEQDLLDIKILLKTRLAILELNAFRNSACRLKVGC